MVTLRRITHPSLISLGGQNVSNLARSRAIAEGTWRTLDFLGWCMERVQNGRDYAVPIRSHQLRPTRFDGFRAFRHIAHHDDVLSQRGGFFLNATRISKDTGAVLHEPHKRDVIDRGQQVHTGQVAEHFVCRSNDFRVEMHREDEIDIWHLGGEIPNGQKDVSYSLALILSSMRCDEDEPRRKLRETFT